MPALAKLLAGWMTDFLLCIEFPHVALAEHSCGCCMMYMDSVFTFGVLAIELGFSGFVLAIWV